MGLLGCIALNSVCFRVIPWLMGFLRFLPSRDEHVLDRVHDRLVSGAAAVIAREVLADSLARGAGIIRDEVLRRDQHAGRAEAALQRVPAVEGLLPLGELAGVRQALDGVDTPAVGLHREHEAAANDPAVHAHRARPAHAVLAADVRASEPQFLAQEVDQVLACGDAARDGRPVDRQRCFQRLLHLR